MHPAPDDLVPDRGLGLRALVLVVREAQVDAAGVHVERLAEVVQRHRRALDVPAREARPPRGVPHHLPLRSGRLPQRPVGVEALARGELRRVGAMAGAQVLEPVAGDRAVRRERPRVEVDGAVGPDVGVALVDERRDEVDHELDALRRARVGVGGADVEGGAVVVELRLVEPRDLERVLALLAGGEQHLVLAGQLDAGVVGEVADVGDVLHHLRLPAVQHLACAQDAGRAAGTCAGCRRAGTGRRSARTRRASAGGRRPGGSPRVAGCGCR